MGKRDIGQCGHIRSRLRRLLQPGRCHQPHSLSHPHPRYRHPPDLRRLRNAHRLLDRLDTGRRTGDRSGRAHRPGAPQPTRPVVRRRRRGRLLPGLAQTAQTGRDTLHDGAFVPAGHSGRHTTGRALGTPASGSDCRRGRPRTGAHLFGRDAGHACRRHKIPRRGLDEGPAGGRHAG